MNLLLDTHTFLWFIGGSLRLSEIARHTIENIENRSFISLACLWEIAIKISLGKLILAEPFDALIPKQIKDNGFEVMDIQVEHISRLVNLPFHHRDPFDRLLVVQALAKGMPVVSQDASFDLYEVKRIW